MEEYIRARSDVYFTGPDGTLRSNRAFCQVAGQYACDLFIGSTLQIDLRGNSSTITTSRIAGFGGAPNMGADARGRRHPSEAWLKAGAEADPESPRCRAVAASSLCRSARPSATRTSRCSSRTSSAQTRRDTEPRTGANHDLRRRRHPRRHGRRRREPAALPQRSRARAGDPRRGRLHRGRARAGSKHGRAIAPARRDPPAGRSRYQPP